jgi:hypothetical protein
MLLFIDHKFIGGRSHDIVHNHVTVEQARQFPSYFQLFQTLISSHVDSLYILL